MNIAATSEGKNLETHQLHEHRVRERRRRVNAHVDNAPALGVHVRPPHHVLAKLDLQLRRRRCRERRTIEVQTVIKREKKQAVRRPFSQFSTASKVKGIA